MSILTVGGKVALVDGKPIIPPQGGGLPQQEKSVTITKNGQTSVTPDAGKTLSKVNVTVSVPSDAKPEQAKTARITANGTTKVLPDSGKVLSEVDVVVDVPSDAKEEEEKTVSITKNGTTEITPASGKVLSKATVNVNVPQPNIGELSVTANGTYTAGLDFDAWNKVTVNVPQSGGDPAEKIEPSDITFYDYDGTVVAAWTLAELANKTSLPNYPTHDGLTCQGWNWTLTNLKTQNTKMNVGAMYVTDDGKTRIYIRLEEGRMSPCLSCYPKGTVTVDWGDGTSVDVLTGTSNNTIKRTPVHNYESPGDYVINLTVSGTANFNGGNYGSLILAVGGTSSQFDCVYQNSIQKVELGTGVTSIGVSAFYGCYSLTSVTIPSGVTSIGGSSFRNCYSLTSVTIPSGVTSIGVSAFYGCYSLTSVTIPSGVSGNFSGLFYSCNSLTSLTFPKDASGAISNTCSGCFSLASVTIPSGVTSIGGSSFRNCYSLTSVTIPSGVTSIGASAFYGCYSLVSVTIPSSVTSIGSYAFHSCYCAAFYNFKSATAVPTLELADAFTGIASDCKIIVPSSLVDEWKNATNWATYADYIVGV